MSELESYCTFNVGTACCGVSVSHVREIVSHQEITPVPLSHDAISGLINLRGQILAVVDVARWLRLPGTAAEKPDRRPACHLIADLGGEAISLCVDEMGPVITPQRNELDRVPSHVDREAAARIQAVARMPDNLVMLLDLERLKQMRRVIAKTATNRRGQNHNLESPQVENPS
jgi:purine-binding chemotaxis protein CheW